MDEHDYNVDTIRRCVSCDWCADLEDSTGRTIYFCMDADSPSYLEEVGLLCGCNVEGEVEM